MGVREELGGESREGLPLDCQGEAEAAGARALQGELPLDHQGGGER